MISSRFLMVTALFVTCLITANIIAVKIIAVPGGLFTPAGIIVFPLSYLFGDVLTEIYGYAAACRVIWIGFACNLLAVVAIYLAGIAPSAPFWTEQMAYNSILGFTPRLLLASFLAYLAGEFANSFVMAKLKIATNSRFLWMRTIGSTLIGQGLDTCLFILVAFTGVLPSSLLLTAILTQWTLKVAYEIVATPLTYWIVGRLKHVEYEASAQ